jgi:hypothetical protein
MLRSACTKTWSKLPFGGSRDALRSETDDRISAQLRVVAGSTGSSLLDFNQALFRDELDCFYDGGSGGAPLRAYCRGEQPMTRRKDLPKALSDS